MVSQPPPGSGVTSHSVTAGSATEGKEGRTPHIRQLVELSKNTLQ